MTFTSLTLQPAEADGPALNPIVDQSAPSRHPHGSREAARQSNAPLDKLKRQLRPGPTTIIAGPGYTYTSIAPLQIAQEPAHSHTATPLSARFSPATSRWLKARSTGLTHKLHPPAPPTLAAQRPDSVRAKRSEFAFASCVEALFGHDAMSAVLDGHIQALIDSLAADARERPLEAAHVRFAGALQCARALSAATGGNAAQAVAALDHLRHQFSLDVSLDASSEETTAIDAARHAWHTARLLSQTNTGFDALVTLRDDPALHEAGENGAMKRESLRTFLQAASYLAESCPEGEPVPDSAAAQWCDAVRRLSQIHTPSQVPHALALNALLCAAKVHAMPDASAKQIGDASQIAAYVAWRSGYRESGPDSPLSRTQGRIAKFMTWIRRAEQRATDPVTAFDPRRLAGMRKSPLTAMAYDAGGANLGLASREAEAMHEALQAALDALSTHLGALIQRYALPLEQRGVLLLRQQCLARWKVVAKQSPKAGVFKLSRRDRETIVTAVAVLAPNAGLDAPTVLTYRAFTNLKTLDLKTLERWSHDAAALGAPPKETSDPLMHIARVREIEHTRPIRPMDTTRAAFQATLAKVIDTSPIGNNVRYFDGGTYGVNVNSALNMGDFKAMFGLSVAPGIKALRGRHAFLEIGSSSYGGEVFMGTDRRSSNGASLGVFSGVALGLGHTSLHATLGVGVGIAYSRDRSTPSGVIIRTQLQRNANGRATDSWRRQANDVVGFLFEQSTLVQTSGPIPPEQLWQRFSARFFRARDISVNWRDQKRSSHSVSKVGSAMARLSMAGWHAGPALIASYDHLLAGKNERVDANGWLRGVERSRARSAALTLNGSLVAMSSSPGDFSSRAGHPQSASIPSAPIVGATTTLVPSGASVTMRMVDEHGSLNPAYIRRLIEFVDPKSFLSYLETRRESIAHSPNSNARLNAFINEVSTSATRGNQAFGESFKIRPEVAETLNVYRDEIEMIKQCARQKPGRAPDLSLSERDNTQIALRDAEMAHLLNDPQSWKVSGYYTYEINTRGYAAGPSFIAQAMAATSANGERVLAELAISELEALDAPTGAAYGIGDAGGVH